MKNFYFTLIYLFIALYSTAVFGQVPQADKYYTIKNVESNLYLSNDGSGESRITPRSIAKQLFYLKKTNDGTKFLIQHVQTKLYLKSGGANTWDTSFTDNILSNDSWFTFKPSGSYFRINGNNGYCAPDKLTSGSEIYSDKSETNQNGLWAFEEVTENTVKSELQTAVNYATKLYNQEKSKGINELGTALATFKAKIDQANTVLNSTPFSILNAVNMLNSVAESLQVFYTSIVPYQKPEAGKFYFIYNLSSVLAGNDKLYLSNTPEHPLIAPFSGIEQVLYVSPSVKDKNKCTIEQVTTASFLSDGGNNYWDTQFTGDNITSGAMFKFPLNDNFYHIQGNSGHYAPDDLSADSWIYCNKDLENTNGRWLFEEVSADNILNAIKKGLPQYITIAETLHKSQNPAPNTQLAVLHAQLGVAINDAKTINSNPADAIAKFKKLKETTDRYKLTITEKNTPQTGRCYYIKHVNGSGNNLFLSQKENGEAYITPYSGISQIFYLTQVPNSDKFVIDQLTSGKSLTDGGSSSYNTSFTDYSTSNTLFKLNKDGNYYRIEGGLGYYATDSADEGSSVYCDKEWDNGNGLWIFEEIFDQKDLSDVANAGLPIYLNIAKAYYNESEQQKEGSYLANLSIKLNAAIASAQAVQNNAGSSQKDRIDAVEQLRVSLTAYKQTLAAYQPLKNVIETFTTLLNASGFKNDEYLKSEVAKALAVYNHSEDQTANIQAAIDQLNSNREPLWAYRALKTAITNATRMKDTNYGSSEAKNTFLNAIATAQGVLINSHNLAEIRTTIESLKTSVATYLAGRAEKDWWTTIKNGALWKDDRGKTVQAHGAGFLQIGDTWYMIGEDRETATWNPDINMYSTKDFINWKFEGKVVENGKHTYIYDNGSEGKLGENRMIERPKLLYCEKTGQYVIWCHWEAGNYGASEAAVFYSDNITGPYKIHWAGRPLGIKSRDCNVFQDVDGKAYFVSTTNENQDLGVFELSEDYLDVVSHTSILNGMRREAPAIVRIDGQYNMLSSACSGWSPNQCQYTYSWSLTHGWSYLANLNNKHSYDTQAASILTVLGTEETSYLYVGDRWQDPNLAESKTIIFPIQFNGTNCTFDYSPQFDINLVTGKVRATDTSNRVSKENWKVVDYSTWEWGNDVDKAIDGNVHSIWHTRWSYPQGYAPHYVTVDMGAQHEVSGFLCTPRLDNDMNGLIRDFILYVSLDNNTWKPVAGGSWMPYAGEIYFPPVNARYFKLVCTWGDYASVAEIDMLLNTDKYTQTELQPYCQINDGEWHMSKEITVSGGSYVKFGPNAEQNQGSWAITGPNNLEFTGREMELRNISTRDAGIYTAYFLNAYNQISTMEYKLNVKDITKSTTWTPQAGSTDWTSEANWSNGVPGEITKVTIPKSKSYPMLTEQTKVDAIYFEAGAELGRQDLLAHKEAIVAYNFDKGNAQHQMLSIPLVKVRTEDVGLGNNFQTLHIDENARGNWMTIKGDMPAGTGFILSADTYKKSDLGFPLSKRALQLSGSLRSMSSNSSKDSSNITNASNSYQLAGANVEINPNFGQSENNIFALVGNPFMTTIDFNKLQSVNDNLIKNNYQVWTKVGNKEGYAGYSPDGRWGIETDLQLGNSIAPLQGFIVEQNQGGTGILKFNLENVMSQTAVKSDQPTISGNKIDIVAKNSEGAVRTFIAKRKGGTIEFSDRDAQKIINSLTNIPDIYTLKISDNGLVAVGANIFDGNDVEFPLGLATVFKGNITLSFSGMDNCDSKIIFVDKVLNKEVDMSGLKSYHYTFNYTPFGNGATAIGLNNRFSLHLTSTAYSDDNNTEALAVYSQGGYIHTLSANSNLIQEVKISDLNGFTSHHKSGINSSSYVTNTSFNSGIYIVEVKTEKGVEYRKIIISNQ